MKKILFAFFGVLFAYALFYSCDKIDDDRYRIYEEEEVDADFPELDKNSVYRKILIDEFTGHRCTNCPKGHAEIETLHNRYGDTMVVIGIHYGELARPLGSTFSYDFRTEAGNTIGQYYNISGIPKALVNRKFVSGGLDREEWQTAVANVDRSDVCAGIQIVNKFDEGKQSLKTNVKVTMLKSYEYPLQLALYLIEDGIVKPQKDATVTIDEYTHNHVLRAALTNDAFGDFMNAGEPMQAGDERSCAYSVVFGTNDWIPANCAVVAVLYDNVKQEVIQVETSKVVDR